MSGPVGGGAGGEEVTAKLDIYAELLRRGGALTRLIDGYDSVKLLHFADANNAARAFPFGYRRTAPRSHITRTSSRVTP